MEKQTPILDKDFKEELEAKKGFWAYFEYLCAFKEMMKKKNQEKMDKKTGRNSYE